MASSAYTVRIGTQTLDQTPGAALFVGKNSLRAADTIGVRGTASFIAYDMGGTNHFYKGQPVEIKDSTGRVVYSGAVHSSKEKRQTWAGAMSHEVVCVDNAYYADKRVAAKTYPAQTAGSIFDDLAGTYLADEGLVWGYDLPTFTRATIATRVSDGVDVSSGAVRYESVAANMLSAQQSSIESATLPFPDFKPGIGNGGSIAQDTSQSWAGAASLRVITSGSGGFESISINLAASAYAANATYTFSGWLKALTGTPTLRWYCQANDQIAGNTSIGSVGNITLSTSWQRFAFTVTMPADLSPYSIIGMRADTGSTPQAITFYLDGLQIETGSSASAWTIGGTPASSAVRIEEATTNLLSANASNAETDTSGVGTQGAGTTLTRDTTQHWQGAASFKVVTTGSATAGLTTNNIAGTAGQAYAFSAWVLGTAGDLLKLRAADNTNTLGTDFNFTATGQWQRITGSLTYGAASGTGLQLKVLTQGSAVSTFYVDGLQIEAKAFPTSWQVGGTTRNKETLTYTARGGIHPMHGTIQFRAYIDANARRQPTPANGGNLFGVDKGPTAGSGAAINVFHSNSGPNWVLGIAGVNFQSFSDSCTGDGWHSFAVAWDSVSALVYVDGVLRCTQNNPALYNVFAPLLHIGANGIGTDQLNTLYQDIRLSSRKRSAAEIAADAATPPFLAADIDTLLLSNLNGSLAITGTVEDGPTIVSTIVNYAHCSTAFDGLAEKAQFWWNADCNKALHFRSRGALVSTVPVSGSMMDNDDDVSVENKNDLYRNREFVPGGTEQTSTQVEVRKGDGTTTVFTLSFPLAKVPTVETNIAGAGYVAKTVGIKGVNTSGYDFYWQEGDPDIAQDSAGTKLTSADLFRATYIGSYPITYASENSGEVSNNAAVEAGQGPTTGYVDEVDSAPASANSADAAQIAAGKLSRYAMAGRELKFKTRTAGIRSGTVINVTLSNFALAGVDMLVQDVQAYESGLTLFYEVTAVVGPVNVTWLDWFAALVNNVKTLDALQVGAAGTLATAATPVSESWTWSELVSPSVMTCLLAGTGTLCGTGQFVC